MAAGGPREGGSVATGRRENGGDVDCVGGSGSRWRRSPWGKKWTFYFSVDGRASWIDSAYVEDRESFCLGMCYHVINWGNARGAVFHKEDDYGSPLWQWVTAKRLELESSLRPRGRPRSGAEK